MSRHLRTNKFDEVEGPISIGPFPFFGKGDDMQKAVRLKAGKARVKIGVKPKRVELIVVLPANVRRRLLLQLQRMSDHQ